MTHEVRGATGWIWALPKEGEIVPDYPPIEIKNVWMRSATIHLPETQDE
jgi:hypothetical protein